ncbi:DUF3923 family protein [uncultured Leuconostoc sp.]|uniref:DUF3923 family protein n=1 Tax=uncultured Leuconostoc sp. TaxID=173262 RepID=UPI0025F396D9|nr:DUF3923 family protein [uncultured Leuconostoc sp.]
MRHKRWLTFTITSIILFLISSIFLWMRDTDGAGAIMNNELRLLNLGVLFIFFVIIWLIEFIVFLIIKNPRTIKSEDFIIA